MVILKSISVQTTMHPMYMVQSFLFPKPGTISDTGLAVGTVGELHDDVACPGCGLK